MDPQNQPPMSSPQIPPQTGGSSSVDTAPSSPVGVPGIPDNSIGAGQALSQEEMKANLQAMAKKLEVAKSQFDSHAGESEQQKAADRSKALEQLFDLLSSRGVDPSKPEEVQAFLDDIKSRNPVVYQQIEQALQVILGNDNTNPQSNTPVPPTDNMNINNPNAEPSQTI